MTLKSVADSMRSHNTEENTENTATLMNMVKAKKSSMSKPLPRATSKSSEDDDTSFSSQGLLFDIHDSQFHEFTISVTS